MSLYMSLLRPLVLRYEAGVDATLSNAGLRQTGAVLEMDSSGRRYEEKLEELTDSAKSPCTCTYRYTCTSKNPKRPEPNATVSKICSDGHK